MIAKLINCFSWYLCFYCLKFINESTMGDCFDWICEIRLAMPREFQGTVSLWLDSRLSVVVAPFPWWSLGSNRGEWHGCLIDNYFRSSISTKIIDTLKIKNTKGGTNEKRNNMSCINLYRGNRSNSNILWNYNQHIYNFFYHNLYSNFNNYFRNYFQYCPN